MTSLFKKSIIISLIILMGGIIAAYTYFNGNNASAYDFVVAEKHDIFEKVSVTGRVEPAESVELAFEKFGKVSAIYADVGDKVSAGQTLVALENSDIVAQLHQAEANFEVEQAKLNELEKGTREEEVQIYQTKVANAERSLTDAENNLETEKQKAATDLDSTYNQAITAALEAVEAGKAALLILTDIQYAHFANNQDSSSIASAKARAVDDLLGQKDAGRWVTQHISPLNGGAFGLVQEAFDNPTHEKIDKALTETLGALQRVKQALDTVPVDDSKLTTTEKTNLSTEKNNINVKITTISQKQSAIAVQKEVNAKSIASAKTNVLAAQNTLASAKDELALKQAGSILEQIVSQKAKVKVAQANVEDARAQVAKTVIRAPISGTVTRQDAKAGQIASANTPLVSLISASQFEIEVNIPEEDIAKVNIGNVAQITLDAYGRDVVFEAKVVAIDPAETIVDGITTYNTTLQFMEKDERIRSGMTANIEIQSAGRENVISVLQRAVIKNGENKFVRIVEGENFREAEVETGLRGSDGNIEIISGVHEGDKIITSFDNKQK